MIGSPEKLEHAMKYRSIFETSPYGVLILWDVFEECNDKACQLLACGRNDILGHTLLEFSPPGQPDGRDSAKVMQQLVEAAFSGIPQNFHWRSCRKDGVPIDMEISMQAITADDRKVLLIHLSDITERMKVEAELIESNKRYQVLAKELREKNEFIETITDNLPIGFAVISWPGGKVQYANKKIEEIIGWTKEIIVDRDAFFEHLFPDPEYRREIKSRNDSDMESGDPARMAWEFNITKSSGEKADILTIDIPMIERDLIVVTCQDISERKRTEKEILKLNQELEARVVERTRELEQANKELEAFTYSVSHDLRAPLRAINGFSEALLEEYSDKLDDDGNTYLRYLQEGSREMGELIEGLLKLSRSTRGDIAMDHVDLSAMAATVRDELRKAEPERRVNVSIAPGVEAVADPRLLRVVMENLLGNAWKYTSRTAEARIELGVAEQAGKTVYFVRGNGAGFDMAYAGQLFLPFHRLHKTSEFPGIGIGLATVERIIHRHGGQIWAEAAAGEGATFYFTLGEEGNIHGTTDHSAGRGQPKG